MTLTSSLNPFLRASSATSSGVLLFLGMAVAGAGLQDE